MNKRPIAPAPRNRSDGERSVYALATPQRRRHRGDATILRAMEILRSRLRAPGQCLNSPGLVRAYLALHLAELEHEVFMALFLDSQNRLIDARELSRGTLTQTSVYPREVVKEALSINAAAVIFAHNHPSGCTEPSTADEMLTSNLKSTLALVGIKVVDHLVVAGAAMPISFSERGLL